MPHPPSNFSTQIENPHSHSNPLSYRKRGDGDGVGSSDYQSRLDNRAKIIGEGDTGRGVERFNPNRPKETVKWMTDERKKSIETADDHARFISSHSLI